MQIKSWARLFALSLLLLLEEEEVMGQANATVKDKVRGRSAMGNTVIEVRDINIRIVIIAVSPIDPSVSQYETYLC